MSSPYGMDENIPPGYGGMDDLEPLEEDDRYAIFMPAVRSLVNAMGGYEEVPTSDPTKWQTVYRPGDSVLSVLKDLKKLWRKDDTDDERTVARCMAEAGLMKELVGLVKEMAFRGAWGRKVSLMAFDLIAALTWPIDVEKELKELAEEGPVMTDYATLLRAQVEYKALVLNGDTLRSLLAILLPCFAQPRRGEKEDRIISLGLHIVRNLLAIRDVIAPDSATGERQELSTLQSALIIQLEKLTYMELFATLASGADRTEFNAFNMLVLDIVHLIFRSVKPSQVGQDQARAPVMNLAKRLEEENRIKAAKLRNQPSRHNRFGTTISVRNNNNRLVLHSQNAVREDAAKVLDDIKKKRAPRRKRVDELTLDVNLTPEAIMAVQRFIPELSAAFNYFIMSVLKDIRMERSKVRPTDNIRALFVASFVMECHLLLREMLMDKYKKEAKEGDEVSPLAKVDAELPLGQVAEMIDLDSLRWVTARMRISMDDTPPAWVELQASIDCFTQILLFLDSMAASTSQEDVEAAEVLQDQLYYNGDILDSALAVVSNYKAQSVAYLEAVVTFAYVLLRMLEKYSKSKTFMFVRKRAAKKQRRPPPRSDLTGEAPIPEEYQGGDSEDERVPEREGPSYAEHAFTFAAYEKRFANAAVTETLVAYLSRYKEFTDPAKLRRVAGLMHRQAVKAHAEGLYFQVSCLHLFRKILDDQANLVNGDGKRDLLNLLKYILRQFFKCLKEDPFLIVQAFMPKSRGKWKGISGYASDDDGMGGQRDRIREQMGPAELEFIKNKKLSWSQQMGAIIKLLMDAEHEDWIGWIIGELEIAHAARTEVVFSVDGEQDLAAEDSDGERAVRNFAGPSKEAVEKFAEYQLVPSSPERVVAVQNDMHLRLMLRLLSFEQPEVPEGQPRRWILPTKVLPHELRSSIGALEQYLADPLDLGDASKLLRKQRKPRARRPVSDDEDEDGNPIPRPPRRRKNKALEVQTFKSAAFIMDSDDDDDTDAAFFAREAQLRAEMQQLAEVTGNTMRREGGTKKRKKGKKSKTGGAEPMSMTQMERMDEGVDADEDEERMDVDGERDEDGDDESEPEPPSSSHPRRPTSPRDSDSGDSDADDWLNQRKPAPRVKRKRSTARPANSASDDSDVPLPRRRPVRRIEDPDE